MSYNHPIYVSKAPKGLMVKIITCWIYFLLSLLTLMAMYFYIEGTISHHVLAGVLAIVVIIIIVPYMYSPQEYILTYRGVVIERPIGRIFIPYDKIVYAEKIDYKKHEHIGNIRLWGSSGFYSIYGKFKIRDLGYVNLYITDENKCVLIKTIDNEKYIISPENINAFLHILKNFAKHKIKYRYEHKRKFDIAQLYIELHY